MPDAVLWDMDGTLVDSEKLWDIPLFEITRELGGELSAETRAAMVGSNIPTTLDLIFAEVGVTPTPSQRREITERIDRRMLELFVDGLEWRPGAQEALKAVRATGVPMALVTSTERALTDVALATIGRDLFDVTVCGDEVDGRHKPQPEPYLRASRMLDVDPAACVAVEDSPTGIAAATGAGCAVLAIPCEVPIEPAQGRVVRDSLVGVDLTVLADVLAAARQPVG
ncbi:HAD superfamily hydrolase (TIGR01509 family) [Labedaea rhizosphaerae]|uniref:HAD superfamily hydrolase (TIGR01509 family) n=2 Tax=Labedaea rhizosphaerae TaxID=598644 RepID=A0A4R6S5V4_LABRH|nr:HAD family phosphatase [Labedaea rhizosphaerae]TDP95130.1 HAD superfamily hydrolase (TIGR01509 family) [Labedaea rhizosphaerae]